MEKNELYGDKVKNMRVRRGMTQEDLARELNVSKQAVSNWERGKCRPDEDIRDVLGKYFGVFWSSSLESAETLMTNGEKYMKLKRLSEISTIEEMQKTVSYLLGIVHFDFAHYFTIRYWTCCVLTMVIGVYKGLEWFSKIDNKAQKRLISKFECEYLSTMWDPEWTNDWCMVCIMINRILRSYIAREIDGDKDLGSLDQELGLFYTYYVSTLKDIYFTYYNDKPDRGDLTYQLLEAAEDAHLSFGSIFRAGLSEPSDLSLSFRTVLYILQQEIIHEFAATQLSEEGK